MTRIVTGALLLAVSTFTVFCAANYQKNRLISGINVIMNNKHNDDHFLISKDVEALFLKNEHINVEEKTLETIDLDEIERIAESNPWVKNAEIFVDNKMTLNIELTQRVPKARIFTTKGGSFYIDSNGFEMPLSERYAYPVPVFTGFVKHSEDSINEIMKHKIIYLSNIITDHEFWNQQITQIEHTSSEGFVLFGTTGDQRIIFGDTVNAYEKLNNLYSFYKQISNKIGWDKYTKLDLRYDGQVVASPALDWHPETAEEVEKKANIAAIADSTKNITENL